MSDLSADHLGVQAPVTARSATQIDAHVGMMVKMRRTELNLSQEKVAEQLGITSQQLLKYERGTNRIGASRLHQLARILGVSIQYFFAEIDDGLLDDPTSSPSSHPIAWALGDASTMKLLRLFSEVRDPVLKNRVISIVQAVIGRD